jgi:diguanylate cyclase (GGDEF)-like protein
MQTPTPQSEPAPIAPLDPADFSVALGSDLFYDIPLSALRGILARCTPFDVAAGDVLIRRGTRNEYVLLVLRGSLHVHLDDEDLPHRLTLGPGECAGEISVIDGRDASATVVAAEASRLMRLDRSTLWHLVSSSADAARNLLLVLSKRMRQDNDMLLASLRQRREFERIATVDGLTGLHNRRWLDDAFPRQLELCQRGGTPVSLLLVDVDHFKLFNDRHGHLVGDRALQHVAHALVASLKSTDLVARYGGEEFAALLPGAVLEQAVLAAERMRRTLGGRPFELPTTRHGSVDLTVSVGVAQMRPGDSLQTLYEAADAALYVAKSAGRNRVLRAAR